jgi:Escherichia/Staphylococcus phage prohead protease
MATVEHSTERRTLQASEVRAVGGAAAGEKMGLEGYAAKFNTKAYFPTFVETINKRAFDNVLAEKQDVRFLLNHDPNFVFGRTAADTLKIWADDTGLRFSVDLPSTQAARDLHTSVLRGDLDGMSFGFGKLEAGKGAEFTSQRDEQGEYFVQRELKQIGKLLDVSIVTYPAYNDTDVVARNMEIPTEIRSAVDTQNAALKLATESRDVAGKDDSDCTPADLPANWTDEQKTTYCTTFNAAFAKARAEGLKGHAAFIPAHMGALVATKAMWDTGDTAGTDPQPHSEADTTRTGEKKEQDGSREDLVIATPPVFDAKRSADDAVADNADEDEWDLYGPEYNEDLSDSHVEGDCADGDCSCQNIWCMPGRRSATVNVETRGMPVRTKRVGGKNLPASKFDVVGDPDKTETWSKVKGATVEHKSATQELDEAMDAAWRPLVTAEFRYFPNHPRENDGTWTTHLAASRSHYEKAKSHLGAMQLATDGPGQEANKTAAYAHLAATRAHQDAAENPSSVEHKDKAAAMTAAANECSTRCTVSDVQA